jgi:GT2 family glycosyltransferase
MKFGAVYCLYDDHEYLDVSLETIKNKLDKVLFLMSDIPWNGKKIDNSSTIQKVKNLCKQNKNFELIEGHWTNEIDQRNFGLTQFYTAGIDYCFIIDSDEMYYETHFENIKEFIKKNPQIAAFHVEWNTYWTKQYYVISPREYYKPVIAVKVDSFQFTTIRHGVTSISRAGSFVFQTKEANYNGAVIPPQLAFCFHFSYARTNEYIKRKLETNSHAPEFLSGWYEKVWLNWTPNSKNLHPVTPQQYETSVKENFLIFPDHFKKFIKKERNRKCSIVLLNWNSWDLTKRCLEMISKTIKNIDYEIILVDNGSKDIEGIKSLDDKRVVKVFNKENLGFAGGVNEGIKKAKSTNDIVLINVDAEPQESWLDDLYTTLESNPFCGLVGPLGNNIENGYQKEKMVNKDTQVFNLHFYCVLIFRETINKIGLFDTRFKIGGYEDNDFCIRSNLAGYQCWISAKSLVKHEPHQVFKLNKIDNFDLESKNKQLLQDKLIDAFYNYGKVIDYYSLNEVAKKSGLTI